MTCKALHPVDGYQLNTTDGYGYTGAWWNCSNADLLSFSVVFTGGTPVGTLHLEQSNDIPDYSGMTPLGYSPATLGSYIQDGAPVPNGITGLSTASVNGAKSYVLSQYRFSYAWVRVVFVAASNVNTQLDIYMSVKY